MTIVPCKAFIMLVSRIYTVEVAAVELWPTAVGVIPLETFLGPIQ